MDELLTRGISEGAREVLGVSVEDSRVRFPDGTQYKNETAHHPEQVMHRWMLPSGSILTYTELTDPDEIERLKARGLYQEPCLVVHESMEARALSSARGGKTWKDEFGFIWNPPAVDPETMSVADLFGGRCTDCLASLKDDGECPVCGDMPTPGMVATRRQWLKDHPQDLEALFDE